MHASLATPPAPPTALLAGYARIATEAKVATASPHQLVALLYGRLAALIAEAGHAATGRDTPRRLKATEKALAIVDGLDATLDIARGGSVAEALHQVYALLRGRLIAGDAAGLAEAQASVREIGAAWGAIAPR